MGSRGLMWSVAVVLSLTACGGGPEPRAAAPSGDPALRVMSFNVRYGTADDGDDAWPLRRDQAVEVVRDFGPHLLGVQEALRFQLDELAAALPRYGEVGVGRADGATAGEYAAILYDRERLEVVDSGTWWLSDTPDVPGSTSWGNRITRIVTWARLRDRATGVELLHLNTHWDHESQPSRERSADFLLARLQERSGRHPVVVTGDFNAGEGNPAYDALLAGEGRAALIDPFRVRHPDATEVGTFHAFTGRVEGERIDAVLASPDWAVEDADIVRTSRDGRFPSDHYPVTAVLRFRR